MADLVRKTSARSYYDYFPPNSHAPGDIWRLLPTHGLLRRDRASALVVTPSCDLLNRKVCTITYLPIISFLDWVSSRDFLPEVIGTMLSLVEQLGPLGISSGSALERSQTFSPELSGQLLDLDRSLANKKLAKSLRNAGERYMSGGKHLKRVSSGEQADIRDLEACLTTRRWLQIRTQVVRNAFRSDLYFLPADGNVDADRDPSREYRATNLVRRSAKKRFRSLRHFKGLLAEKARAIGSCVASATVAASQSDSELSCAASSTDTGAVSG